MTSKLLDVLKKYNDAGLNLPTLLAMVPLVVTSLITLRVAYGDIAQAIYMIGEIGLIQMWTQGIGSLLVNTIPFVIAILMLYSIKQGKQHPVMYFSALLLLSLVYFVTSVMHIIMAIILMYIFTLYDRRSERRSVKDKEEIKSRHEKISTDLKSAKSLEEIQGVKKDLSLLNDEVDARIQKIKVSIRSILFMLGSLVLIQVVLSYPVIPRTTLTLDDNHKIIGLVMKRDDDRIMIYDQEDRAIKMAYIDNIKTENVCAPQTQTSLHGFGWSLSRLVLEYHGKASVPYAMCNEA